MAGVFDFLHIKQRTAGSSNELSFDVLEHKSAEADEKTRSSKLPKTPSASKGSYHGVAGSSTLSGQAEVEKRKKARRSYRLRLQVVAVVAIIAIIALGVYSGVRIHEDQMNFAARANDLVDRLSSVDDELVVIDEMMADPLNGEYAEKMASVLEDTPRLTTELNRISVEAQSLADVASDDRSKTLVDQVSKAALARNGMMSVASESFRFSAEARGQVDRSNRIWTDVLNADQLAREAISEANKAKTPDAARSALDKLHNANDGFTWALSEINDISGAYGVDLSAQQAYLEKKTEALGYAIETSEALLAGDRDGAKKANEKYNDADAEAVELAATLPPTPTDAVQERLGAMMGEYVKRYNEARNRTVEADSIIRDYLG